MERLFVSLQKFMKLLINFFKDQQFDINTFINIFLVPLALAISVIIIQIIYYRNLRIKKPYRIIWKKSSKLKPEDIFGSDFHRFNKDIPYHYSEIDYIIKNKILNRQNILIVGKPLAGKTRAIYQNLKELEKVCYVLVPKDGARLDEIIIPKLRFSKGRKVIVLDNFQNFLERDRPDKKETSIREFIFKLSDKNIQIITSCRSGFELALLEHKIDIFSIIKSTENIVKITELEEDEAKKIVKEEWNKLSFSEEFDGTIGSLILPLNEMKNRFNNAIESEKNILVALNMLYITGIYSERGLFLTDRIKLLCSTGNLEVSEGNFKECLSSLETKEFIEIENYDEVRAKDVYLEKIVKSKHKDDFEIFADIIDTFKKDPEALFMCGIRAYDISLVDIKRPKYLGISITAFKEALRVYTLKDYPIDYGMTKNNLGNTYGILAEVKDKEGNCGKAITAFKEALRLYTLKDYPIDYAMTKNNLGYAYRTLAGVKDKEGNCGKAITAFKEVLRVHTLKDYPIDYAMTKNNLGYAYKILAEVKDKEGNCGKAITAFKEVLRVYTLKDYPIDYAMTKNNLGTAYGTLAGVKDKEGNCGKAITAFKEVLRVHTLKDYPIDYAMTKNNLGYAYGTLAEVKDKEGNCGKAITAFKEALRLYTLKDYPIDYAMTKNNLGYAYRTLAGVKDKEGNCGKAITAFKEALRVRTLKDYPIDYAMTKNNLGNAYRTLAEVKDKEGNCGKAITAFKESLKVFTEINYPMLNEVVKRNMELLKNI